ncbi:MAG: metal-dependent hydrolase [Dehalococcoidales bacterium]
MQLFAHIGITLGVAWVLQKTVSYIKQGVPRLIPNYVATGNVSDHTTEIDSKPQSKANWLDYRFLLLGSILPDIIDKIFGVIYLGNGRSFCHTLLFTALILAGGICLYRLRKSPVLLCIALGCVTHVLLDTMWLDQRTFFWPLFGWNLQTSNVSFGLWVEHTFNNVLAKPSEYIPEIISVISLVFFYLILTRNGKISHFIKSKLSLLYQGVFSGHKQKRVFGGLVLSKGTSVNLVRKTILLKRPLE